MIRHFIVVGILLLLFAACKAQEKSPDISNDEKDLIESEIQRYEKSVHTENISSRASSWFDVTYYKLNLSIDDRSQYLHGTASIKGICLGNIDSLLEFDLADAMHIDSVLVNGVTHSFHQDSSSFKIELNSIYSPNTLLTIDISYGGIPVGTGFGSFVFGEHSGVPWVWSLSEPYGARDWFPCKDHPSDKADSADIIVTCDSSFKVGSNGKLISVIDNGNGTKTHHWQERYPIASYLISVAMTNYSQFSNWFHYSPVDSMEVLNYILPERFADAQANLQHTVEMLQIFSDLFGLYPFVKEKYGHADFGRGGAMEHQTMTSTTTYNENTIAHELAHQWFGDMITCRTWHDLWLNEGFAQYSTALYLENKYGPAAYWNYMQAQLSNARSAPGSLYVQDTTTVKNLFDGTRVYAKGASVLHMLRRVLGDSLFFRSMYNYANHPRLKYSTASTDDFKAVCESTGGLDLSRFFDEWIYGESYPRYSMKWDLKDTLAGCVVILNLKQPERGSNPAFFTMPIDVKLFAPGWDTTITIFNNISDQTFYFLVDKVIKNVQIDPNGWILKEVIEEFHPGFTLNQNYPNPCRTQTTIRYQVPSRMHVNLSVYNLLGQKITTLVDDFKPIGIYEVDWNDMLNQPSGVYYFRLKTDSQSITNKLIHIR